MPQPRRPALSNHEAMFSNAEKLTAVILNWVKPMFDTIVADRLGQFQPVQAANEWVKKYFPVAANYSIVNDLSFLAVPATEIVVEPLVRNAIAKAGIADQDIPAYTAKLVDALIGEAESNGKVTIFNTIEFEKADFERLRTMLDKNLPQKREKKYEVIE